MVSTVFESWGCSPDNNAVLIIAENALDRLRPALPEGTGHISINVDDLADEETLEALFIEDAYELKGIYSGVSHSLELHDILPKSDADIWLFRLPILKIWIEKGDVALEALILQVMLEEISAHYRWSEQTTARLHQEMGIAFSI